MANLDQIVVSLLVVGASYAAPATLEPTTPALMPPELTTPTPAPPPYDQNVGLMMMGFHKAVCCGSGGFHPRNTGKRRFISDKISGATAGVGVMTNRNGCFVAMQGTHTKQQWWLNADFISVPFRNATCLGCHADSGFLVNYESVSLQIFEALVEFGCKQKPLYLVGHSLGAAGVHYLLYDALEGGYTVAYAYALESPRPGNKVFAEALQKRAQGVNAWRTTHHHDVVVQVPPPEVFSYSHALFEIFYSGSSGTHYRVCNGVEDTTCADSYTVKPWLWTMHDHCWYANQNPCSCGSLVDTDIEIASTSSGLLDSNPTTAFVVV